MLLLGAYWQTHTWRLAKTRLEVIHHEVLRSRRWSISRRDVRADTPGKCLAIRIVRVVVVLVGNEARSTRRCSIARWWPNLPCTNNAALSERRRTPIGSLAQPHWRRRPISHGLVVCKISVHWLCSWGPVHHLVAGGVCKREAVSYLRFSYFSTIKCDFPLPRPSAWTPVLWTRPGCGGGQTGRMRRRSSPMRDGLRFFSVGGVWLI